MSTKEKIKKELDSLPDNLLKQVYEFLNGLKHRSAQRRKPIKPLHLKGRFDSIDIRKAAYE